MRIKEKEGVRPKAKRSNNIQPVARQHSTSAHAQFQFSTQQLENRQSATEISVRFFSPVLPLGKIYGIGAPARANR
jgi:hypothetical protein